MENTDINKVSIGIWILAIGIIGVGAFLGFYLRPKKVLPSKGNSNNLTSTTTPTNNTGSTPAQTVTTPTQNNGSSGSGSGSAGSSTQGVPSVSQLSNSDDTTKGIRTQVFEIGSVVNSGVTYDFTAYSYTVKTTAVVGDTPISIASKIAAAINATGSNFNADGSVAPYIGLGVVPKGYNEGFPPKATSNGNQFTVVLYDGTTATCSIALW